jgi:hypothetical protein
VFSAEPEIPVFRVSRNLADAPSGIVTFCCELSWDVVEGTDQEAGSRTALEALGVVGAGADAELVHRLAVPAFAVPSAANRSAHHLAMLQLAARGLPVQLAAGGVSFGADTFNEQVVQGLLAASEVGA